MEHKTLLDQDVIGHIQCPTCHGPAWYVVKVVPENGELVQPEECLRIDGGTPEKGDPFVCGTCGLEMNPHAEYFRRYVL
jgi:hypothetical protein